MFFETACKKICEQEKEFLLKVLDNSNSKLQELNTTEDVYIHFDKKSENVSRFINDYIQKSTAFIPRLRVLSKNKEFNKSQFKSADAISIITYLIDNHLFDLDTENIALINKLILLQTNSLLAITYNIPFKLNINEFIKLIKNYVDLGQIF